MYRSTRPGALLLLLLLAAGPALAGDLQLTKIALEGEPAPAAIGGTFGHDFFAVGDGDMPTTESVVPVVVREPPAKGDVEHATDRSEPPCRRRIRGEDLHSIHRGMFPQPRPSNSERTIGTVSVWHAETSR